MGLTVNRKRFWDLYHKSYDAYGDTTQATVDALNDILDRFEGETRLKYISHYAYVLATSFHETGINGNHFVPVKEGRERVSSPRRANQDRYWNTGFYGRGQVQTTHRENYAKLGKALGVGDLFVEQPDLLLTPQWSYESLVYGLSAGLYRGDSAGRKTLKRYLKGDDATLQQYTNARDIVNGDVKKNGLMIANYAEKFEHILTASQVSAQAPVTNKGDTPSDPQEPQGVPPVTLVPTSNVVVEEETTPPFFQKIKLKFTAGLTAIGGLAGVQQYKEQAQALGLPETFLGYLLIAAIVGFVLWLVYQGLHHLWLMISRRWLTTSLVKANSTPGQVIVACPEDLDKLQAEGWTIIRRDAKFNTPTEPQQENV